MNPSVLGCQAPLKALDEVVDFLVGRMPNVTDAEDQVLHLSQTTGNLYPKIILEPAAQRGHIETLRGDYTRYPISRLQSVDLHSRPPHKITDAIGNLSAANENIV